MGCVYNKQADNVFSVYNVDDHGCDLNRGKIEVTCTELIVLPKGQEAIRWPLRSLRRYGYDAELFSFESGRRCPTGPGIYAFRCRHAEALFLLVQDCIQRAGEDQSRGQALLAAQPSQNSSRPNSRPQSQIDLDSNNVLLRQSFLNNTSSSGNGGMHLYVNGPAAQENHEYINTNLTEPRSNTRNRNTGVLGANRQGVAPSEQISYAELDLPSSTENLCDDDALSNNSAAAANWLNKLKQDDNANINYVELEVFRDNSPVNANVEVNYINVGGAGVKGRAMSTTSSNVESSGNPAYRLSLPGDQSRPLANYANVPLSTSDYMCPRLSTAIDQTASLQSSKQGVPSQASNGKKNNGKIHYIQLDLNKSSDNLQASCQTPTSPTSFASSIPDSPTKRVESYVTIDFDKTTALQKSRSGNAGNRELEEGVRKTRHNSTINEI